MVPRYKTTNKWYWRKIIGCSSPIALADANGSKQTDMWTELCFPDPKHDAAGTDEGLTCVTRHTGCCLKDLCKKRLWFQMEGTPAVSYQADVIIYPFGIIQLKITLHPANQRPVRNICPWCNRKKSLEVHTRVAHSPHDTKSHQNLCVHVCCCICLSVFLFICAWYWRHSDIEQKAFKLQLSEIFPRQSITTFH